MTRATGHASLEGRLLDGRFLLRRRLGAGNFGAVYEAEQRVFGLPLRSVALKLFGDQLVSEDNASEVLNDAVVLMQLQEEPTHRRVAPHLVTVLDAGFLHDVRQAFIAMEYVGGYPVPGGSIRTLEGMIRAFRPVPVDLALRWMTQVLTPLAWMHSLDRPVLHCDLKSDNVLACGRDTLKVADFGLAQLALGVLGTGGAAGALTCQAPETLMGHYPTPASDVYSLGLLFYEVLAGENPLADIGLEALAADHEGYRRAQLRAREVGLPLEEINHPDLGDHPLLVEVIGRCLRFRPSDRYDDAAAVLREIQNYSAGGGTVLLPPVGGEPEPEALPVSVSLDRLLAEAELLIRKGRLAEARARCDEARARFPKSVRPLCGLAAVSVAGSDPGEALRYCALAQRVDGDDPEVYETTARVYEAAGQPKLGAMMRSRALALGRKARR